MVLAGVAAGDVIKVDVVEPCVCVVLFTVVKANYWIAFIIFHKHMWCFDVCSSPSTDVKCCSICCLSASTRKINPRLWFELQRTVRRITLILYPHMCTLVPILNPKADGLAFKKNFDGGGGRYYT